MIDPNTEAKKDVVSQNVKPETKQISTNQEKEIKIVPVVKKKEYVEKNRPFLSSIVVGTLDLIGLILLGVVIFVLPTKAQTLKNIRNEILNPVQKDKIGSAESELKVVSEKTDKVLSAFPNDSGLVEFVRQIDILKSSGVVKNFSFANKESVKDKTQAFGIPFVLEMEGSWSSINGILEYIQKTPYLIRAITVDIKDEGGVVVFKYGGIIYVKESINKN